MRISVEFDNVEEMQEFAKSIHGGCSCSETTVNINNAEVIKDEAPKETIKKKNTSKKSEDKKKEEPKKEDAPKVEAEVTGVDESANNEPVKDVEPKEEDKSAEDEPKITKEQLRAICADKMKAGKQAEVKAVFEKHGASKLPEVKEEDYVSVYKEVEAIQ